MAAWVERRAACGASYNACASGATPCKFETRQPARPAGKATADRQFQRRVGPPTLRVPMARGPRAFRLETALGLLLRRLRAVHVWGEDLWRARPYRDVFERRPQLARDSPSVRNDRTSRKYRPTSDSCPFSNFIAFTFQKAVERLS